jgi:glycosyltransferase involved in cell wall biosynthesis
MRVLIATTQVPFIRGGAEIHAEQLRNALITAGHEAEIVAVPFKWYPPERILDHMLACRLLDLAESCGMTIDRVIGLKFPAYLIPHTNKVLWILHQHRQAYELWADPSNDLVLSPYGVQVRDAIRQADKQIISEAKAVFANSYTVAERLKTFCGIASEPLYHPPQNAEKFYCAEAEDYLLFPSRLEPIKRQSLVLEALAQTSQPVRVHFMGNIGSAKYTKELKYLARKLKLDSRIDWLGYVNEDEKISQYAHARGVIYPPLDEDYGYVTLEAMLSSKPVITCGDSCGPTEFVINEETGLVTEPTPSALADALDRLWLDSTRAKAWGKKGRSHYESMDITWSKVIEKLMQ